MRACEAASAQKGLSLTGPSGTVRSMEALILLVGGIYIGLHLHADWPHLRQQLRRWARR